MTNPGDAGDPGDTATAGAPGEPLVGPAPAAVARPAARRGRWCWLVPTAVAIIAVAAASVVLGIRYLYVPTESPAAVLPGPAHEQTLSLVLSPGGKKILAGSFEDGKNGTVRLWDVASRRQIAVLPTGSYWMRGLAFSPDGRTLAGAADQADGSVVYLWDVATGKRVAVIRNTGEQYSTPNVMTFSPDGKTLAVASAVDLAAVDVAARRRLAVQPDGSPRPVIFQHIRSLEPGTQVMLQRWTLPDGTHLASVLFSDIGTGILAFDAGSRPAPSGHQPVLQLQDPQTRNPVANLISAAWAGSQFLNPDGSLLASDASSGSGAALQVKDIADDRVIAKLGVPGSAQGGYGSPAPFTFSPDSEMIAWQTDADNNILVWRLPSP